MYCIDDRCYLPMHSLITDMVDSCGGSTKLIRALNRLGMCSSLDTLSRVIQQQVKMREQKGPELELHPSAMMIVSADNIDFLHSYVVEDRPQVGMELQSRWYNLGQAYHLDINRRVQKVHCIQSQVH